MQGRQVASGHRTGRASWLVICLVSALFLAIAVPAVAVGPHDKATGNGSWINGGGLDFHAEFNAHAAVGNHEAKGSLYQNLKDGSGGFTVDVDTVIVGDGHACFGGITDSAWGVYGFREGQYRWTTVVDGGSGEDETGADFLRGGWVGPSAPTWCTSGDPANNDSWYLGNVQVHFGG